MSFAGDTDVTENPVEPVKVHSEKELLREFEKIAATLVPEKDWSLRIAAMQRIEALVYGGLFSASISSFLIMLCAILLVHKYGYREYIVVCLGCKV